MNVTLFKSAARLMAILLFSLLNGCGGGTGGDGGGGMPSDKVVATVAIVDGNNQTATVGTELPNALVALIKNSSDQPIAGQIVNFVVTTGGGSVFAGAASSDANGMVRERWTLGTAAGVNKVEVRAVDSSGAAVVFVTFTATGTAGAPASISILSGDGQSASQLQSLPQPATVIVTDTYGNPVPSIPVVFAVNSEGSAVPGSVVTDATGSASSAWTLGQTIGTQTLNATVSGLAPITFSATATQAPAGAAKTIVKDSGDSQTVQQHLLLPAPLQVLVVDTLGNPVPGIEVTFSAAAGSGYIVPIAATTDSNGKASWRGYFHTAGQQNVNAAVTGLTSVTFSTSVGASSHQYDGNYLCFTDNNSSGIWGMDIINGLIPGGGFGAVRGTLNEADGTLNASIGGVLSIALTGQISLGALNSATVVGTYSDPNPPIGTPPPKVGPWNCNRQ